MPEMRPPSSAMSVRHVSAGSASPRTFAISVSRIPSYFRFAGLPARPITMPSHQPCSLAHVMKSLSVLILARTAGSFKRAANAAGPPSRAHTGKNALQPWFMAVYGYWLAVTSSPLARAASIVSRYWPTVPQLSFARIFKWKMCTGIFASSATRIAKRSSFSCSKPSLPMCDV